MSLLPPSPLLDETIVAGQLGHIADHEVIHHALNNLLGAGTWDAMQAITPQDGQRWYTTDQGIDYAGVNGVWVRRTGYIKDIWVTDYGWKCDNQLTSASDNVAAYNAALAVARAAADATTGGHKAIFIPEAPGFTTAYVDDVLNFERIIVVGVGGSQRANFTRGNQVRVAHTDSSVGTAAVFEVSASLVGVHGGCLKDLYITGYSKGVRVRNSGLVDFDNVGVNVTGDTGLARNHALELENSFQITSRGSSYETFDTDVYSIGAYATDGGPIAGIAEAYFRDGVMSYGSFYFENQVTATTTLSSLVTFENFLTENQANTTYLTVRDTGSAAHGLDKWEFNNDAIFDSAGSSAFFDFDGGGHVSFTRFRVKGECAATYLIKSVNQVSLGGWTIDSLSSTQTLFDPASSTTNVYGMKVGDKFGSGHSVRGNQAASANAAAWGNGVSDMGYRVGKAIGETHARGMWRSSDAAHSWGSGSAVHDTVLRRTSAGVLKLTDATESTGGRFIVDTLTLGNTPATTGAVQLGNNKTITARNAANNADIDMLLLSVGDVTTLKGSQVSLVTTAANAINLAPNGVTSVRVLGNGQLTTSAGTTTRASLSIPHGAAPTSPVDGDVWTTTAGLFVRVNGATVGPLS